MKKTVVLALLLMQILLLSPIASAQLPWDITDLRCGNGKLDDFELCDGNIRNLSYCEQYGQILEIDTACDSQHCTCLPRVNMAFCGNNKREGAELCDGTGPDKCPEFGNLTNMSLKCNPKTCGCSVNETLPADYSPLVVEQLENASEKASVCGDKRVERAEDCDPPNTLCTTNTKEAGVCTEGCKCLTPEQLAQGEQPEATETTTETNVTETTTETNETTEANITETIDDQPAIEQKEPGFLSKIWTWIIGLFS
ncbi:hypothetical protein HY489_01160 [Candidatus Woesearchaeota archaeon]|nr:hypothetical protein [Candidatus Woesearchaeota archaeon]